VLVFRYVVLTVEPSIFFVELSVTTLTFPVPPAPPVVLAADGVILTDVVVPEVGVKEFPDVVDVFVVTDNPAAVVPLIVLPASCPKI
jgi:hypothetical protein